MKKLMIAALMMMSAQAFATDAFRFKNLGFSADGRYYAFVQHVIQDGSGFPNAKGQVIDVAQNRTVEIENVVLQDETAGEKQAIDQVIAKLNLGRYGIDGKNPGQTLWMRYPTDLSPATLTAEFSTVYGVDGGASSVWPKYKLEITEHAAPASQDCYVDARMITLSLSEMQSNRARDLQVDRRLPGTRACSYGYQMRQVLRFGNSVAAILRYETIGFEGPDYKHMVVTGANALN